MSQYQHNVLRLGRLKAPYRNHGWTLMQVSRLYEVTRTSNIPYIKLDGVPPYLAKRPEACFAPEE